MITTAQFPTPLDAQLADTALKGLESLARLGPSKSTSRTVQLKAEGATETITITVPQEALRRFAEVLAQMANGNAVTIVPVHAELTTQQAADFLNVSRPFLVSLLDEKKIPHRLVGTHRRVRFEDLLSFKQADNARRLAVLDELAQDAQVNGHGY